MRTKLICGLAAAGALLLIRNLYVIFLQLPDDAEQGPIYRILFFHVPAWFTSGVAIAVSLVASILYLVKRDLKYDAIAVATTEVAVAFLMVGMTTGSIWGRHTWGIWWTWDARLTSAFVLCLLYGAYLVMRTAIDEPAQRARLSAVLNIFAFADVPIVWYSIEWFRTQHPAPVLRAGGFIDPAMRSALYLNWLAVMLVASVLVLLRLRQEDQRREIDLLRRVALAH
ncbi:MAG: cytochrome c biogenesis protein CcsA [Bryobacteraceae bacterium]